MTDVSDVALEAATNAMNVAMQMEYGADFSADVLKRMARAALTAALPHLVEDAPELASKIAAEAFHRIPHYSWGEQTLEEVHGAIQIAAHDVLAAHLVQEGLAVPAGFRMVQDVPVGWRVSNNRRHWSFRKTKARGWFYCEPVYAATAIGNRRA